MRVLVITNMYPPHHYGGYELNCQEWVDHLRGRGHDVEVLTSEWRVDGVPDDPHERGVDRSLHLYWDDHVIVEPSLARCLRRERADQRSLRAALDRHQPDVVSVWHMGCVSLGLLTTLAERPEPVVHVVNDDWLVYGPLVDRWTSLHRRLGSVAARTARLLGAPAGEASIGANGLYCFVSDHTRRRAHTDAPFRPARTAVTHCGINTDHFPIQGDVDAAREWGWRLLHVGRIDPRKGIDTAIRALAQLPRQATLDVVGRGDDHHLDALRALVARLGLGDRVRFDVVGRRGLAERYRRADAVVFTPTWDEPFGLVPLEAMACGTPVVATATGGSAEFLRDRANALIVPRDDPEAVAAAACSLADDPELRIRLTEGGIRTASTFTLDRWFERLEQWHLAELGFAESPSD